MEQTAAVGGQEKGGGFGAGGPGRLKGINAICDYYDRPWNVVLRLIENEGFPAVKVEGRWEAVPAMIDRWHHDMISRLCFPAGR